MALGPRNPHFGQAPSVDEEEIRARLWAQRQQQQQQKQRAPAASAAPQEGEDRAFDAKVAALEATVQVEIFLMCRESVCSSAQLSSPLILTYESFTPAPGVASPPMVTTRTSSPYFSPKSAIAPASMA